MENGNPIYAVDVVLGLELIEIDGKEDDLKVNSEFTELSKEVSNAVEKYCKNLFTKSLKILRENKTDVLGLTVLLQTSGEEFKAFYNNLEDEEDVLNHVNFQISVRCKSE